MHISFSPIRHDEVLTLARLGDILVVNGEEFDFSALEEGAELPADAIDSAWFCGAVTRHEGALHFTLLLPHGDSPPAETRRPAPIIARADGPITLPPYCQPKKESADEQD